MPPFFKKRRRGNAGPNKNEKKVMRGQGSAPEMLLKDKFPAVQSLSIRMEFFTPQRDLFEGETREFGPEDPCDFTAPCPGRCGGVGSFDLSVRLGSILGGRRADATEELTCPQALFSGPADPCGYQLRCRIQATYNPE